MVSLITLQPSIVKPGDEVKLTIQGDDVYVIELTDSDLYFKDTMSNTINASAGEYIIKVKYTAKPGTKTVNIRYQNGSFYQTRSIIVNGFSEADLTYLIQKAGEMEEEINNLNAQIAELQKKISEGHKEPFQTPEYVKSLEDEVTSLKSELIKKDQELESLNAQIKELNKQISQLNSEIGQYQLEKVEYEKLKKLGSPTFIEFTRFGFFFMVAFTVGILISLLRR